MIKKNVVHRCSESKNMTCFSINMCSRYKEYVEPIKKKKKKQNLYRPPKKKYPNSQFNIIRNCVMYVRKIIIIVINQVERCPFPFKYYYLINTIKILFV